MTMNKKAVLVCLLLSLSIAACSCGADREHAGGHHAEDGVIVDGHAQDGFTDDHHDMYDEDMTEDLTDAFDRDRPSNNGGHGISNENGYNNNSGSAVPPTGSPIAR